MGHCTHRAEAQSKIGFSRVPVPVTSRSHLTASAGRCSAYTPLVLQAQDLISATQRIDMNGVSQLPYEHTLKQNKEMRIQPSTHKNIPKQRHMLSTGWVALYLYNETFWAYLHGTMLVLERPHACDCPSRKGFCGLSHDTNRTQPIAAMK